MKGVAVVASARIDGNCREIADAVFSLIQEHVELSAYTMVLGQKTVQPCHSCEYECFASKKCPLEDDVADVWTQIASADLVLFLVPTYGGLPPSLFSALFERWHGLWYGLNERKDQLIMSIVLSNQVGSSVTDFTFDIVKSITIAWGARRHWLLHIHPRRYQKSSLDRGLVKHPLIRDQLYGMAQEVVLELQSKQVPGC